MTEDEAKEKLFKLHYEYMMHTPKERLKLYDQYKEERNKIKEELKRYYSKTLNLKKSNLNN